MQGVLILGIIVLIRTFLSMALQVAEQGLPRAVRTPAAPEPGRTAKRIDPRLATSIVVYVEIDSM